MRRLARFGPPIAWMAVIAVLSGGLFGATATGSIVLPLLARLLPWASAGLLHGLHVVLRKLGHVVEYGILATLWLRALAPDRPARHAAAWAVGLSALYAVLDETRQALAPNRTPSALDVLVDAAGAFLAVACLEGDRGALARPALVFGRWAALLVAAGSLAAAALDWGLGLPAWDLVGTGLGAAGVALLVRRVERRRGARG